MPADPHSNQIEVINSDSSSSDEEEENSFFDMKFVPDLIKAVRHTLVLEEQDQTDTGVFFARKKKHVFPVHKEVQDVISAEWQRMSRKVPVEAKMEKLYPFPPESQEIWSNPPTVDAPVARLSRKTALPIDDVSALKQPMERRMETELKKLYMMTGAMLRPAVSLVSVIKALSMWIEDLVQRTREGEPREKILAALEDLRLATSFCLGAAGDLTRLSARSMASSVVARRALWLKYWFADTASKNALCRLPFEGKMLFGKALEDIISKSSGGKSTFLPQAPRRFKDPPKRQSDRYFSKKKDDFKAYRPGRETFRSSSWKTGQSGFFRGGKAKAPRSPKSQQKSQ
ncbi:lamina-associated polypeptide 2-like [Xenopus laevis]|uniref:Lamina-associated polypeptide 2-like n=1 Tax=Xenopus laevis TaxID=8355 RepID=A0A8J1M3D4_XENLA|nr:lamina-associated polypeptide 2-like [Xenopus laevis]